MSNLAMGKSIVLPVADEKARYVNQMFARIAPTYDLMNRLMTGGQDVGWRRELIAFSDLPPRGRVLDVGTGTGDIALEAKRQQPGITAIGVDFTFEMMAVGREKGFRTAAGRIEPAVDAMTFIQGDTYALPFADNSFDAVVSGFLLRNVVDRRMALTEQLRVVKPGGKVLCLETTPPGNTVLGPLFQFYFFRIVPLLGQLVSGDGAAYSYLPQSTVEFPAPDELTRIMEQIGLRHVFYRERMFGSVAIYAGIK
jgi:demethylmenaquinone methyltransferase / 2-methoxy-6-polyprenyl-1,4-benzoquinol methylase